MKYSRQRELIRKAVEKSQCHPTADAVYQEVRKKEPTISLATVYRNLHQLADNRMIRRVVVPGDSEHFDHKLEYHEHMICTQCGCIMDIWPEKPLREQLEKLFPDRGITDYDFILYGLCCDCVKKKTIE